MPDEKIKELLILADDPDPNVSLLAIGELRRNLTDVCKKIEDQERLAVRRGVSKKLSWAKIGAMLGMSKQAAWEKHHKKKWKLK